MSIYLQSICSVSSFHQGETKTWQLGSPAIAAGQSAGMAPGSNDQPAARLAGFFGLTLNGFVEMF